MNNKHTPGPWTLPTPEQAQRWGAHFLILDSEGGSLANAEPGFPMELGTVVANARLMAAAPELLEALQALEPFLSTEAQMLDDASLNEGRAAPFDVASVKARAAIAKATGEKS